jgi:hypothetical protein
MSLPHAGNIHSVITAVQMASIVALLHTKNAIETLDDNAGV